MSKQSYFKQFSLVKVQSLVLFDPSIGPYQSGIGSDGNEGVLRIPQSSIITAEMQSMYSSAPADWAK